MARDVADWLEANYPPASTVISLFKEHRSFGINLEKNLRNKGFGVIIDRYDEKALPLSYEIIRDPKEKLYTRIFHEYFEKTMILLKITNIYSKKSQYFFTTFCRFSKTVDFSRKIILCILFLKSSN